MDDLTELQRFSLDFWTEAFGDNESRTDEQAENLGYVRKSFHSL
jgi:hypothetical protein